MALFEIPEPTADLVLDEGEYAGAEIKTRLGFSPAIYFAVQQWLAQIRDGETTEAVMAATREGCALFAQYGLISWNLSRDGEPVPGTLDGMLSVDYRLMIRIITIWWSAVGTVPVPLPATRTTGPGAATTPSETSPASTDGFSTEASSPPSSTERTQAA